MNVRITKQGSTFGMIGVAAWDSQVGKWEVSFRDPWVGFYAMDEVELLG